jgi:hypothetical protein
MTGEARRAFRAPLRSDVRPDAHRVRHPRSRVLLACRPCLVFRAFPRPALSVSACGHHLDDSTNDGWMLYGGMRHRAIDDMSTAMPVVAVVLISLGLAGTVAKADLALLEHALMMPAMLIPMFLRLDLYTGRAGHTMHTRPATSGRSSSDLRLPPRKTLAEAAASRERQRRGGAPPDYRNARSGAVARGHGFALVACGMKQSRRRMTHCPWPGERSAQLGRSRRCWCSAAHAIELATMGRARDV